MNSSASSSDGRWDRSAIRAGGMVALVFAVPFSVAAHGIVTAAVSYIVPQAVLIVIKIARGGEVRWTGQIFNLTIMFTMGVLGGLLGSSMRKHGARPRGQR
jgi:hypothetical protein